ncbi:MAG: tryptophan synthase subunit alpha [Microbacteriaceae bacterium]|nr:tryptophan synthase subunit alpha [Microbacteriaceae bacterium]
MSGVSVKDTIARCKSEGRGVLVAYLPAGFPSVAESVDAAKAALEAGADILEFGVPYSDPVMDGVVIAEATQKALEAGFKLKDLFTAIADITSSTDKPVLVMTYWNPVVQYGVDRFAHDLKAAGGAGLITPDLIPDEAAEWMDAATRHGLENVFLAAPSSSDERLRRAAEQSHGFVYAVSTMGITGTRDDVDSAAKTLVERLYANDASEVCVGLGISSAEQVRDVVSFADGAIVGSALVRALADAGPSGVATLVAELRTGTPRA